jgi:pimeloyl-ACP methyl ester carboxylesterase
MGVQVALETYRRHRQRVRALVLVCGAPEHPLRTFRGTALLESVLPAMRAAVGRAPGLASALTRRLLPTKLAYSIATRLEVNGQLLERADFMPYLRGMSRLDPALFLAMLDQAGRHSAVDLLPDIQVPVLIIAGRHDGFTPAELSRSMQEAIPEAELLMVERGSHTAPLERPEFVNRAVLDFLDRRVIRVAEPKSA